MAPTLRQQYQKRQNQKAKLVSVPIRPAKQNAPSKKAKGQIKANQPVQNNQIISGYFINDQSYKQMRIERLNSFLYCVLGLCVFVCLVANYFVVVSEMKLNKIQKDTLALNYENEEMQNKLDNLRSYHYVDETVSRSNILHKAQKIMELPQKEVPIVKFEKNKHSHVDVGFLGY